MQSLSRGTNVTMQINSTHDYYEIAEILCEKYNMYYIGAEDFEPFEIDEMAKSLEEAFDPEEITYCMTDELGQGMLLGKLEMFKWYREVDANDKAATEAEEI